MFVCSFSLTDGEFKGIKLEIVAPCLLPSSLVRYGVVLRVVDSTPVPLVEHALRSKLRMNTTYLRKICIAFNVQGYKNDKGWGRYHDMFH